MSTVSYQLKLPRPIKPYFRNSNLWVEYDENITQCPKEILYIPAVTLVAPVSWANGYPVETTAMGSQFRQSLLKLYQGYKSQYPSIFPDLSTVVQSESIKQIERSGSKSALLFSGGVDSLACYANHMSESPDLVTIHGSDLSVNENEGWKKIEHHVNEFAEKHNLQCHFIRSNFRDIFRYPMLDRHLTGDINRGWWGAIQYGTALPAMCAPIGYRQGYSVIYQGSGYTQDPTYPTAQPGFVNELFWSPTSAKLTEVDLTRQEKIDMIASSELLETPIIRSCYRSATGDNCSACEKCYRTMIGLHLAGVDPEKYGYDFSSETVSHIKSAVTSGTVDLSGIGLQFWGQLQESAKTRIPDAEEDYIEDFYRWFKSADLSAYANSDNPDFWKRAEKISNPIVDVLPYPLNVYADDFRYQAADKIKKRVN